MLFNHFDEVFSNLKASGLSLDSFNLILVWVFRVVVELFISIAVDSNTEWLVHLPGTQLTSSRLGEVRLLGLIRISHKVFLVRVLHFTTCSLWLTDSRAGARSDGIVSINSTLYDSILNLFQSFIDRVESIEVGSLFVRLESHGSCFASRHRLVKSRDEFLNAEL